MYESVAFCCGIWNLKFPVLKFPAFFNIAADFETFCFLRGISVVKKPLVWSHRCYSTPSLTIRYRVRRRESCVGCYQRPCLRLLRPLFLNIMNPSFFVLLYYSFSFTLDKVERDRWFLLGFFAFLSYLILTNHLTIFPFKVWFLIYLFTTQVIFKGLD